LPQVAKHTTTAWLSARARLNGAILQVALALPGEGQFITAPVEAFGIGYLPRVL
jgi:hypothetical protein